VHGLPLIALLIGSLAVTAAARRLGASPPLVLVVVGIAVSFVPGMPDYQLDPELILLLVLPPLLYSAALDSSATSIKANLSGISSLAVGLVLFTTVTVGLVAHWLMPELPLAAAFALGAIVSPPDAVAAVAVGRRLGLPRRVMTMLTGESLLNDATALTAWRVAVAAATMSVSAWTSAGIFAVATVGGIAVGLAFGWAVHAIRLRLGDWELESAAGLVVPFAAYLVAEELHPPGTPEGLHPSGVLAVVMAGLYLGHRAPEGGFATRLQDTAVWKAADTVLEALVFALIGLQLPVVTSAVEGELGSLLAVGLALTAVAVLARPAWVFPSAYLRQWLSRASRASRLPGLSRSARPAREGGELSWRYPAVVSWAGMRGVVSLAAASALPLDFPGRDTVVFLAFLVTVGTLLLQGLTLPWVIRWLGVRRTDTQADALAEAQAQHAAAQAALARLDELTADDGPEHLDRMAARLRTWTEQRSLGAWERLGRPADEAGEAPTAAFRRLRREMLVAERDAFVRFRSEGRIDDEVLRRVLRELDLEEALLARD
jgi:monovalent cation/hydrogen antiporter